MEEVQDSQHYNANIIMPRLDKHETRVLITLTDLLDYWAVRIDL